LRNDGRVHQSFDLTFTDKEGVDGVLYTVDSSTNTGETCSIRKANRLPNDEMRRGNGEIA
jgi:hypothetical protein